MFCFNHTRNCVTIIVFFLVIGLFEYALAQDPVPLHSDKAEYRDKAWIRESKGFWWIHAENTLYKIVKAKMTWTFPGPTGEYHLKERLYSKANGPAPCWVAVDGKTVWQGQTPLPQGQDFIYCCGNKNTRDCDKKKGPQELVWVDTKTKVFIQKGAKIEHWGETAYHCQPSGWKSGTIMTQYGGGTYSGFAEMQWVPTGQETPIPGLSTKQITFNAKVNGQTPDQQTVTINNKGSGTLPVLLAKSSASWLTVKISGSGNTQSASNTIDISGLTVGTYTDAVDISGPDMSKVSYTVTLNVTVEDHMPVTVLAPNGGEEYKVGDTMNITWKTDLNKVTEVDLFISVDDGIVWHQINLVASISENKPQWGNYPWKIPGIIDGTALGNTNCLIKVAQYPTTNPNDISDKHFSIAKSGSAVVRHGDLKQAQISNTPGNGSHRNAVHYYSISGREMSPDHQSSSVPGVYFESRYLGGSQSNYISRIIMKN